MSERRATQTRYLYKVSHVAEICLIWEVGSQQHGPACEWEHAHQCQYKYQYQLVEKIGCGLSTACLSKCQLLETFFFRYKLSYEANLLSKAPPAFEI